MLLGGDYKGVRVSKAYKRSCGPKSKDCLYQFTSNHAPTTILSGNECYFECLLKNVPAVIPAWSGNVEVIDGDFSESFAPYISRRKEVKFPKCGNLQGRLNHYQYGSVLCSFANDKNDCSHLIQNSYILFSPQKRLEFIAGVVDKLGEIKDARSLSIKIDNPQILLFVRAVCESVGLTCIISNEKNKKKLKIIKNIWKIPFANKNISYYQQSEDSTIFRYTTKKIEQYPQEIYYLELEKKDETVFLDGFIPVKFYHKGSAFNVNREVWNKF